MPVTPKAALSAAAIIRSRMPVTVPLPDEAATIELGGMLAPELQAGDLVAMSGEIGAGKTTLARAILRAKLGDPELEVPSPTFTLVQTYETPRGAVWHFDAYRLARPEDAVELGIDEALSDGIVLVEWPERIAALLPEQRIEIALSAGPTAASRIAELRLPAAWATRFAAAMPPR
jgi:tRNA threonylcarbamoyl adenosine modification protein YjeE